MKTVIISIVYGLNNLSNIYIINFFLYIIHKYLQLFSECNSDLFRLQNMLLIAFNRLINSM